MQDAWKRFLDEPGLPVDQGPSPRVPHEHDESYHSQASDVRDEILQAYRDLMNGLVDTDLHGWRGVEELFREYQEARP